VTLEEFEARLIDVVDELIDDDLPVDAVEVATRLGVIAGLVDLHGARVYAQLEGGPFDGLTFASAAGWLANEWRLLRAVQESQGATLH
jgi:hypothetical protein